MTNYKAEEFKKWLEIDPSRKKDLPESYWEQHFIQYWLPNTNDNFNILLKAAQELPSNGLYIGDSHKTIRSIVRNWMLEVDCQSCGVECISKKQLRELSQFLFPNQSYNFSTLQSELKRLKIQDLTIQIPLKKQELEQLTNNLKSNLNNSGKYLLEKLLKKQNKLWKNNETNSNKLEEMKQILKEDLGNDQESLNNLLSKQKEIYELEKHLINLQSEQVAQIQVSNN